MAIAIAPPLQGDGRPARPALVSDEHAADWPNSMKWLSEPPSFTGMHS